MNGAPYGGQFTTKVIRVPPRKPGSSGNPRSHKQSYQSTVRASFAVQHLKTFTVYATSPPLHSTDAMELLMHHTYIEVHSYDLLIEQDGYLNDLVVHKTPGTPSK
ncbi:hypothetical protein AHF37_09303 [Paragonimus kellicotti]|nr:hypothetical protein AHF37_09303 [Paragonimus kellicotti]